MAANTIDELVRREAEASAYTLWLSPARPCVVDAIALSEVQVIKTPSGTAMTKNKTVGPAQQASVSRERQARQAAALRENLHKRKARQRQRNEAAGADHTSETPHETHRAERRETVNSVAKAHRSA
jgi:hypothetical protein